MEAGCSLEAASLQAAATDGGMDTHLTPEIMLNQRGIERSPSADHTSSSPESPGVKDLTQQGNILSIIVERIVFVCSRLIPETFKCIMERIVLVRQNESKVLCNGNLLFFLEVKMIDRLQESC